MIAECYDLSVQCDNGTHVLPVRSSFTGPNRRYCWAEAKRAGWVLLKDGSAKCPRCASGKASTTIYRVKIA